MRKFLPAICLALFALSICSGCRNRTLGEFEYTLTADHIAGTANVDCRASSSGSCHFAFTGDSPSNITIGVGERATVTGLGSASRYCAASHSVDAGSCKLLALPERQAHVSSRTTSDADSGQ